jgi:hypothetical protein
MQKDYDDAQIKSHYHSVDEKEEIEQNADTSSPDHFKYPLPDFPLTQQAMKDYHKEIEGKM